MSEIELRKCPFCGGEDKFVKTYYIQKAKEMHQKKIASLKKQIKNLEEMRFE